MRYSYVQKIPDNCRFALLHGILDYGKKGTQTRADRLRRVPATEEQLQKKKEQGDKR